MVKKIENDDSGYLQWLNSNPKGFVVNSNQPPRPNYLMIHRATCRSITGKPSNGEWWTKNYTKICSNDLKKLKIWAKKMDASLKPCKICKPNY